MLAILSLAAIATAFTPVPVYFDASLLLSGLFLYLLLGLFGPGAAVPAALLAYGGLLLAFPGESLPTGMRLLQILFVAGFSLAYRKGLLLPVMLYGLLLDVPLVLLSVRVGWIDMSPMGTILLARDFLESMTCALAAEVLLTYMPQPGRRLPEGSLAHSLRKDGYSLRNVLIHASYGPLLLFLLVIFLQLGRLSQQRTIGDAQTRLVEAMETRQRIIASWSTRDQDAYELGSPLVRARLADALEQLAQPDAVVLLRATDGSLIRESLHDAAQPAGRPAKSDAFDASATIEAFRGSSSWEVARIGEILLLRTTGSPSRGLPLAGLAVALPASDGTSSRLLLLPVSSVDNATTSIFRQLATILPVFGAALVLLMVVSLFLERALRHLSDSTIRLESDLRSGSSPAVAGSRIREVNLLARNFGSMGKALEEAFSELQSVNDDLLVQAERLRDSERHLHSLAHFDALTGLPNRMYLVTRLQELLDDRAAEAGTKPASGLSLFLIDLDRFKPINDTLGHDVGDATLKAIAEAFRRSCGDEPQTGTFAARLGGDEFAVVLSGLTDREVEGKAAHLLEALTRPLEVMGHMVGVAASLGISKWPDDGTTTSRLLRHADLAMYRAKQAGGSTWRRWSEVSDET